MIILSQKMISAGQFQRNYQIHHSRWIIGNWKGKLSLKKTKFDELAII